MQDQPFPLQLLTHGLITSCRGKESLPTVWLLVASQVSPLALAMLTHLLGFFTQLMHKSQASGLRQQEVMFQSVALCVFSTLQTCLHAD